MRDNFSDDIFNRILEYKDTLFLPPWAWGKNGSLEVKRIDINVKGSLITDFVENIALIIFEEIFNNTIQLIKNQQLMGEKKLLAYEKTFGIQDIYLELERFSNIIVSKENPLEILPIEGVNNFTRGNIKLLGYLNKRDSIGIYPKIKDVINPIPSGYFINPNEFPYAWRRGFETLVWQDSTLEEPYIYGIYDDMYDLEETLNKSYIKQLGDRYFIDLMIYRVSSRVKLYRFKNQQ